MQPIAETNIEAAETAILTISANPTSYAVGTPSSATVTITSNQPPTAVNNSYSTNHDKPLIVTPNGVLANDSDPDGDPLSASLVQGQGPAHGGVMMNADGSFTYAPQPGYVGADSFQYQVTDGIFTSIATVTINVTNATHVWDGGAANCA